MIDLLDGGDVPYVIAWRSCSGYIVRYSSVTVMSNCVMVVTSTISIGLIWSIILFHMVILKVERSKYITRIKNNEIEG